MNSDELSSGSDANNQNDINNQNIGSQEDKEEPQEELTAELKKELLYYYFYLLGDPIAQDVSSLNHEVSSMELKELEERLRYLCNTNEFLEPSEKSTEILVINDIETVDNAENPINIEILQENFTEMPVIDDIETVENGEKPIKIEILHENLNDTYCVCEATSDDNEDDKNLEEQPTNLQLEMIQIKSEISFDNEKINILEFNNNNNAEGKLVDPKENEEAFAKEMMLQFRTKVKNLKHLVATSPHLRELLIVRLEENALQELDFRRQQNDENFLTVIELIRNTQKQKLFMTLILGEEIQDISEELETGPSSPEMELDVEQYEECPFFVENCAEKIKKHERKREDCNRKRTCSRRIRKSNGDELYLDRNYVHVFNSQNIL